MREKNGDNFILGKEKSDIKSQKNSTPFINKVSTFLLARPQIWKMWIEIGQSRMNLFLDK